MKTIAAGIFIIRKDKKLLICHPTNHGYGKGNWSIPKGKIEEGETTIQAALRETFEETNLDLNNIPHFNVYALEAVNYGHKKKMIYPFLFIERENSDLDWLSIEIKCNSNVPESRGGFPEMDEYLWCSLDEAEKLLHETQVACIPKIREIIGKNSMTIN